MIIFNGKNRDMTNEAIKLAWLAETRLIEELEAVDFNWK